MLILNGRMDVFSVAVRSDGALRGKSTVLMSSVMPHS
jgi:hypothetical protein